MALFWKKRSDKKLPKFKSDDLEFHPFVNQICEEIDNSDYANLEIRFNNLLRGFGYLDYNDSIILDIQRILQTCNLYLQVPLHKELKPEDQVTIIRFSQNNGHNRNNSNGNSQKPSNLSPIQNAVNSVVQIISPNGATGTGFIIGDTGLVITARHVVEDDGLSFRKVLVRQNIQKPNQRDLEAIIFKSHRKLDYALLWILKDDHFPVLQIDNPRKLNYTETVYAIGCPGGLPTTVTKGVIGNPNMIFNGIDCIQCDAAIDHGNSGGPLVNEDGKIVGITLWGLGNFAAAKLSLPIDYLTDDISMAKHAGKKTSLKAFYCPSCGFSTGARISWYCPNCGFQPKN